MQSCGPEPLSIRAGILLARVRIQVQTNVFYHFKLFSNNLDHIHNLFGHLSIVSMIHSLNDLKQGRFRIRKKILWFVRIRLKRVLIDPDPNKDVMIRDSDPTGSGYKDSDPTGSGYRDSDPTGSGYRDSDPTGSGYRDSDPTGSGSTTLISFNMKLAEFLNPKVSSSQCIHSGRIRDNMH